MKRNLIFFILLIIAIVISACGSAPSATPTISGLDVENTSIAAAFTVIALTHQALPSVTMIPPTSQPTDTPIPTYTVYASPTNTPIASPTETQTLEPTATFTITVIVGGDPCNALLKSGAAGKSTKVKIVNKSNAPITASLYLNITPFGECGFRGYDLAKGDAVTVTDVPQGCYSVSALINDPKKPTKSFGYGCINNPDLWTFEVYRDFVKFIGP